MVDKLPQGYVMCDYITDSIANMAWRLVTDEQRKEFIALYGDEEKARNGMRQEILTAEHKASFYNGIELMALMWTGDELTDEGKQIRTLGCVTTRTMRKHWVSFAKNSLAMCKAFMKREPKYVKEVFVGIQSSYKQSCEWASRMCGFKFLYETEVNGEPFSLYVYEIDREEEK